MSNVTDVDVDFAERDICAKDKWRITDDLENVLMVFASIHTEASLRMRKRRSHRSNAFFAAYQSKV